jgi:hypothetical protein
MLQHAGSDARSSDGPEGGRRPASDAVPEAEPPALWLEAELARLTARELGASRTIPLPIESAGSHAYALRPFTMPARRDELAL